MQIKVLKSNEIDQLTWQAIAEGFNEVFSRSKTAEEMRDYYSRSALGYSFHALAIDENGILAGTTTLLPHKYIVGGEKVFFGLSGGTFVKKQYRSDIFIYQDMIKALKLSSMTEGVKVIYGVPNKNSFSYTLRFLGFEHLMDLPYYALPVNPGRILKIKELRFFNAAILYFVKFFVYLNLVFSRIFNSSAAKIDVQIAFDEEFASYRFKSGYQIIRQNKLSGVFKIVEEDGVKTAYLLEYRENGVRSFKAMTFAIRQLLFTEKPDLVLYIGTIKHFQTILFKLPTKKTPKRLPLTFEAIGENPSDFHNTIKNPMGWDFGLVNFDVR